MSSFFHGCTLNFSLSPPTLSLAALKMDGLCGLLTQPRLLIITILYISVGLSMAEAPPGELLRGFTATPDSSIHLFQPLLSDPTGNFSLGFLRLQQTQLALAVVHLPSLEPFWIANSGSLAPWTNDTELSFNGSLIISDSEKRVFWSTETAGSKAVLLNTSNLQIQTKVSETPSFLWQSFDFPTDTIVQNQNFTSSMTLTSSNEKYLMRLGEDFIGLYAEFNKGFNQIYYRHKAMEAKARVVDGGGPIHIRISSDGYLGMYQNRSITVDMQPFNSFQRPVDGFLRIRLEMDGNLKGYFWDGSKWVLDYQAIANQCELPSPCGPYGLCTAESGCFCLDNRTEYTSGNCLPEVSGDFCYVGMASNSFGVMRKNGIELPFKELMSYTSGSSMEECESFCERNCSCWGSVFNNASGFCYFIDYPIQTLVSVEDDSKIGYFKVRESPGRTKMRAGLGLAMGILGAVVLILVVIIMFVGYKIWRRRSKRAGVSRFFEEEHGSVTPGPYKNLGSASFKSIEMSSNRF